MTPWKEFKKISKVLKSYKKISLIIDPYGILNQEQKNKYFSKYLTLGN